MKITAQKSGIVFCGTLFIYSIISILFQVPFEWYAGDLSDYIGTANRLLLNAPAHLILYHKLSILLVTLFFWAINSGNKYLIYKVNQ
jgi:hypothetical protein